MAEKSLIIIGAGIAGLAAGCYGQMNGYHTEIYEMHSAPGGLCAAWKRKGYTFDGCIHWLMGTSSESPFYHIWNELGVLRDRRMIGHEEFARIVAPDGKAFIVYTDRDRLERHMKELSPADGHVIDEFMAALRQFEGLDMAEDKPRELMGPLDHAKAMVKMAPALPVLSRWSKITAREFASRFSDPFLRQAFPMIFGADVPMIAYLMFLAPMNHGDCGVPEGGSWGFAHAIEQRYLELGGVLHYGCRVAKILLDEKVDAHGKPSAKAVGIRLADGSEHRADTVISAADGHATLFDMLEGKYVTDDFRRYYQELSIFPPMLQVSLGVDRDLSAEPHAVTEILDRPVTIGGEVCTSISYRHYGYDPSMAPEGRTVVESFLGARYDYWKTIAAEPERYEAEKQAAATAVIDLLERHYPGITANVEAVDVATPLTTERYTGNWKGSIEGWMPDQEHMAEFMQGGMSKTLPGLQDFYMIGQWVEPGGGLPGVAPSGRKLIQILCHRDGKEFVASVPA